MGGPSWRLERQYLSCRGRRRMGRCSPTMPRWSGYGPLPHPASCRHPTDGLADRAAGGSYRKDRVHRAELPRSCGRDRGAGSAGTDPLPESARHGGRTEDPVLVPRGSVKTDWEVELASSSAELR
jgi:hypothetical protein